MIPKRSIIPIFIPHIGCPNNCVFCNQRKITGKLKPATAETVTEAISEGLKKISHDSIIQPAFYGGSFTAIPTEEQIKLLGAALPFLHSGEVDSLRLSTRPDAIDDDILDRLKKYGVKTIELGSQSMVEEVLQKSGRGHTVRDTIESAKLIKSHGFELILQMMTGLPFDTKERTIETAKKIIELKPDGVRIYPTVIVENTPLCDMWRAGKYKEHTVENAVEFCSEIVPMFEKADIPIIRLGLNPTDELSNGASVGGAYHPALGELVRSRIMLNRMRDVLKNRDLPDEIAFGVNKSEVSIAVGQHRTNIETLKSEYALNKIKIRQIDIEKGNVMLL